MPEPLESTVQLCLHSEIGHTLGSVHIQAQKKYHLVQHNKQHRREILLSNFHLNGHTLGFHP